eukprot:scaffold62253_cov19-Tisochrysis_lutea.AAC.6
MEYLSCLCSFPFPWICVHSTKALVALASVNLELHSYFSVLCFLCAQPTEGLVVAVACAILELHGALLTDKSPTTGGVFARGSIWESRLYELAEVSCMAFLHFPMPVLPFCAKMTRKNLPDCPHSGLTWLALIKKSAHSSFPVLVAASHPP